MEEVVAAARQIDKILEEQTDSKMERRVNFLQDQIRILKKDLKEVKEQIATHKATALTTAAMAAIPAPTAPTAAATQPPPAAPACHIYHDYGEKMNYHRPHQWIRGLGRHPQSSTRTSPPTHRTNRGHPRDHCPRRLATAAACRQPEPPATCS